MNKLQKQIAAFAVMSLVAYSANAATENGTVDGNPSTPLTVDASTVEVNVTAPSGAVTLNGATEVILEGSEEFTVQNPSSTTPFSPTATPNAQLNPSSTPAPGAETTPVFARDSSFGGNVVTSGGASATIDSDGNLTLSSVGDETQDVQVVLAVKQNLYNAGNTAGAPVGSVESTEVVGGYFTDATTGEVIAPSRIDAGSDTYDGGAGTVVFQELADPSMTVTAASGNPADVNTAIATLTSNITTAGPTDTIFDPLRITTNGPRNGGNLRVEGNSDLQGVVDTDGSGNQTFSGGTVDANTLNLNEVTVNGTPVGGDLNVGDDATVGGTLAVDTITDTAGNGMIRSESGTVYLGDGSFVLDTTPGDHGISTNQVGGDIVLGGDIGSTVAVESNDVQIANNATVGQTLGVTGLLSANGGLAVTGGTTTDTLTVTGATTTNGITNTGNIATGTLSTSGLATLNSASVTNDLGVGGNTTLGGTLAVTGATTTNGITNTGNVTTDSLTVNNNATVGGTLGVTGLLSANGGLAVTGGTTTDTLTVTGATTTNGITNTGNIATDTLSTSGLATLNSASVTNDLAVGGNTALTGNLDVDGFTTTDGIDNTGDIETDTLTVNSNATVAGNLDVDGFTTTDGIDNAGDIETDTLTVNSNATVAGNLDVDGTANLDNTDIDGTLNVQNIATFQSDANVGGNFDVNGFTTTDGLRNDGTFTNNGFVDINGSADIRDDLNVGGRIDVADDIYVAGREGLQAQVDDLDDRVEENARGIAMVAALQHTTVLPGMTNALDVAAAHFEGETGMSINYARRINENWQINFGAASTTDFDESVIKAGVGVQW